MDWQRSVWEWNFIGISFNYVLFFALVKGSRKSLKFYGVSMGKWKDHQLWYWGIVLLVVGLAHIGDVGAPISIPSVSTFFFQFLYVALGEELFWRGFVQTWYGFWYATVGFALLHAVAFLIKGATIINSIVLFLTIFVLSLIFGWIRKKTESVLASSLLHGLYDYSNQFFR